MSTRKSHTQEHVDDTKRKSRQTTRESTTLLKLNSQLRLSQWGDQGAKHTKKRRQIPTKTKTKWKQKTNKQNPPPQKKKKKKKKKTHTKKNPNKKQKNNKKNKKTNKQKKEKKKKKTMISHMANNSHQRTVNTRITASTFIKKINVYRLKTKKGLDFTGQPNRGRGRLDWFYW